MQSCLVAPSKRISSAYLTGHPPLLRSDPLLFGVVDIKEIIDVMSELRRHKLRDVFFHKFLDRVRHLREALIAPVIIPFNDLDPWSLLCLVFNPFSDLFVGGAGSDAILELVCRDFSKTKKKVIQWTIEVVFARGSSQGVRAAIT